MKEFKIVPELGFFGGIRYRIYRRVFWIFWSFEGSGDSWEEAEELVSQLKQPDKFL